MSGTSHTQGRVPFSSSEHFAGEEPVDTRLAQDLLIGGGRAQADAFGQCLVNWMAPRAAVTAAAESYQPTRRRDDAVLVDFWYGLMSRHVGPVRVRADGSSYRLYMELVGASSGGHNVDFGVSIRWSGVPHVTVSFGPLEGVVNKTYSGISSTTPVLATPDAGGNWLDVSRTAVFRSITTLSTRLDIGGTPAPAQLPELEVRVFGRTSNPSSEPHLYGFHLSEFVG